MNEDPARLRSEGPAAVAAVGTGQPPSPRALFWTVFPSIMLPMFLAVADQTIVATALPAIASDLGEVERLSWVVVSYLIANTIAAPVYGRLGDSFGRRRMMLIALALFIARLGALRACSQYRIPDGDARAAGIRRRRADDACRRRSSARPFRRASAAVIKAISPALSVSSSTFGPVAGGYLTQAFGWRSIFLVNVPLGLAAVFLVLRLETQPGDRRRTTFDAPGLVLFMMFVSPVILALEASPANGCTHAADDPRSAGVWARSSLLALIWQEKHSASPLIPPTLFRKPSVWRSRRPGRLPRRRAGVVDHVPADLSARGPRRLAGRDRPAAVAADVRHRHRLAGHRPIGDANGTHRHIPVLRICGGNGRLVASSPSGCRI